MEPFGRVEVIPGEGAVVGRGREEDDVWAGVVPAREAEGAGATGDPGFDGDAVAYQMRRRSQRRILSPVGKGQRGRTGLGLTDLPLGFGSWTDLDDLPGALVTGAAFLGDDHRVPDPAVLPEVACQAER
jgi:hypothetical protein